MIGWWKPAESRRLPGLIAAENAMALAIVQAPATASRAVRRSVGLFGYIWRWDMNASEDTRRTYVPRYIRRHYSAEPAKTRRARRHRAVVVRLSKAKGII